MANKGKSKRGFFGTVNHYDEHGKKVGCSKPGLFGRYTNYDAEGKKVGRSTPGFFGGYNHYDNQGRKTGHSDPGLFGRYHHKDSSGKRIGSSDPGMFGSYHHRDSQGCYVATCVYGSYNCPEVWTLRRFRDNSLAQKKVGRAFICTYYAISPTVVKLFGRTNWFKRMWRGVLDGMVKRLNAEGVEDTPYDDKDW